jgi:hypothetical protein
MYYVNFDEKGNQAQAMWFDGVTPEEDGWYMASSDITGKRYKLSNGEAVEMTEEEISAELDATLLDTSMPWIRAYRDRLLVESDWTLNPEIPISESKAAEWASYRQALRDFPSTVTVEVLRSESGLSWPVRPS